MKKLLAIVILFTLFTSCSQQGEMVQKPRDLFQYKGKVYQAFRIGTGDGNLIWVVLPKDSGSTEQPISIQHREGKHNQPITIIP